MTNLLCDAEGVPLLVQKLTYRQGWRWFEVLFFNGKRITLTVDYIGPKNLGLLENCSSMQLLEVENNITKLAETEWKEWFPEEQVGA